MGKKYPPGIKRAIEGAGGIGKLARLLRITPQAIQKWKHIPRQRIIQIEKATSVPREKLAPELYDR